ncbi:MAG: hypothetical protein SGCHY_000878 [Lobulomycetales sp.]
MSAPAEAPLCNACKRDEAFYDAARKVYSKFCSIDCQQLSEKYEAATRLLKELAQEEENIIQFNDFPPPRCQSCTKGGSKVFDYSTNQYLENCHHCISAPSPGKASPAHNPYQPQQQQPMHHHAPAPHQESTGVRPLIKRIMRTAGTGRATRPPPSHSASRVYYSSLTAQNRSGTCAHCFKYKASNDTNMGIFCSAQCEQGEERVQGVGILVVSTSFQIIVLAFQTCISSVSNHPAGPYKGFWSVFHTAKPANELSRDTGTRLASQEAPGVQITPHDPYLMIEHSTRTSVPQLITPLAKVFSYTLLAIRDHLHSILPPSHVPSGAKGTFAHIPIEQFRQPLGRELVVMDVHNQRRVVSKHTHKCVLEVMGGSR